MTLFHKILLLITICPYIAFSAESYISTGMNKLSNTYNFTASSLFESDLYWGNLSLEEKYVGTALTDITNDFRDLNEWMFKYSVPLDSNFSIFIRNHWYYSNDRQAGGVSKLERLSLSPGLSYSLNRLTYIDFTVGKEYNNKIGIEENGWLYTSRANISEIVDGYNYMSRLDYELLKLDDGRNNSSLKIDGTIAKGFESNDHLGLRLNYNRKDFDNFAGVGNDLFDKSIYKNRLENKISSSISLTYSILSNWKISSNIDYNLVKISEEYNKIATNLKFSGIQRNLEEQFLKVDMNTNYLIKNAEYKLGYRITYRDEKNQAVNKFDLVSIEYENLRNLDKQKDNITNITSLYTETYQALSKKDTLYFDADLSILRYDTPDEQNYSDRDELSYSISAKYKHNLNNNLAFSVLFATNYLHLVYLKSQNSGSNNVNRIFRFNPIVHINYGNFSMNPSFEVLANYTIYDYETINSGLESYSFRQISYNDTISVKLDNKREIQLQNNIRYYETGTLYWSDFKESPETGNYEQFSKIMFYTTPGQNYRIGIGMRYHFLNQEHIYDLSETGINPNIYSGKSFSPETEIVIKFNSKSEISLQGWYEFQYIKGLEKKEIPNLFLTTRIAL